MKIIALIAALSVFAVSPSVATGFSKGDPATTGTAKNPPKCALPNGLTKSPVGIPLVFCAPCAKGQGVAANGYCAACSSGQGVLASGACGHCPDKWTIGAGSKCTAPPPAK